MGYANARLHLDGVLTVTADSWDRRGSRNSGVPRKSATSTSATSASGNGRQSTRDARVKSISSGEKLTTEISWIKDLLPNWLRRASSVPLVNSSMSWPEVAACTSDVLSARLSSALDASSCSRKRIAQGLPAVPRKVFVTNQELSPLYKNSGTVQMGGGGSRG